VGLSRVATEEIAESFDGGRLRRRFDRFRRSGLIDRNSTAFTVEQAIGFDELREAYTLVHDAYVNENYILPQPGGLRLREFEATPEMATFIAKADGRVVGVMSVIPDSYDMGLPSDNVFESEINSLRELGRHVVEVTNLAVLPEFRNTPVFLELSRCCNAHVINHGYDDTFVAISPGHAMFFETILRFEAWGGRRNYGHSLVDIVEGKRMDMRQFRRRLRSADAALERDAFLEDWFYTSNPHFEYTAASAPVARRRFLEPLALKKLFIEESGFISRCDAQTLAALSERWGPNRFMQVCGAPAAVRAEMLSMAA
jgi:hypothetical protein